MATKKGQAQQIAEWADTKAWASRENGDTPSQRVRRRLDAVLDEIAGELQRTGRVYLPGFGVFEVRTRASRAIRTPQGQPLVLPETKEIHFAPARAMVERVTGRRPS